jgi:RES domain-containing protein
MVRAVYCSVDPATAVLEVAVHKGFRALDTVPHVLTAVTIDPKSVFVVDPSTLPNPNWLRPGIPSGGQQRCGDDLFGRHKIVLIPSVVSTASWNLMFVASNAVGVHQMTQKRFALDPRLPPPIKPSRVDP